MMRDREQVEEGIRRHTSVSGLNPSYGGEVSLELLLDIRELLENLNKRRTAKPSPKKPRRR